MKTLISLLIVVACTAFTVQADDTTALTLLDIQHEWAHINYELKDDEKTDAFIALIDKAKALVAATPDDARSVTWLGIIQSSTAGAKGGLGALGYAKDAKASFEKAMKIDEKALDGSAMTSLGVLYHKVPGWPISFGSDRTAGKLLKKALEVNPEGIDPNYFYAEYLYDEGDYKEAKDHLMTAQSAAPRPERPLADKGRHGEIATLLAKVERKL